MIISYEISLKAKSKAIATFLQELLKIETEVCELKLEKTVDDISIYKIDVRVGDDLEFRKTIRKFIQQKDLFIQIKCRNKLDSQISKGLLQVCSDIEIETAEDYKINVLGLMSLVKNRISKSDQPAEVSGISKNTALVSAVERKNFDAVSKYSDYAVQEIESIVLNKFSGYNSLPFYIVYDLKEDFIKNLFSLENSFSAIRLFSVNDESDPDYYNYIHDSINIPVLSRQYDERVLIVFAELIKIVKRHKLNPEDLNVGFIGIDISAVRLAGILLKNDYMRVLGYDKEEKNMMFFERNGGLATTRENIFGNSDIVIVLNDDFKDENYELMRPGIIILSYVEKKSAVSNLKNSKACRKFYFGENSDYGAVFPGIISAMIKYGVKELNNNMLTECAYELSKTDFKKDKSFANYSAIHLKIENQIKKYEETHSEEE